MNHDTLDFTVTIHVPQGAVTTKGEPVILLLERRLLVEETNGPFDYDGKSMDNVRAQIGMELAHRAGTQGLDHGTKVEVSNIDIIWADDEPQPDDECEHCESCPCICDTIHRQRQQVGFGTTYDHPDNCRCADCIVDLEISDDHPDNCACNTCRGRLGWSMRV